MIFYLGNVLFLPQKDAAGKILTGLVDGYGHKVTGLDVPQWDTLFGVCNLEPKPITARFQFWDERTGHPVMWPDGQDHHDIVIGAGSSFSATLIPGNGFPQPPIDFAGHGTIECFRQITPFGNEPATDVHAWSMLSGRNWSSRDPSIEGPILRHLPEITRWVFPYVIPKWSDPNHSGNDAYDTGLSIQNFSNSAVTVAVGYTVNQSYPDAGRTFQGEVLIVPNAGIRKLLRELFLDLPERSEGHLVVTSAAPARLFPSTIIATQDFVFSAGQMSS